MKKWYHGTVFKGVLIFAEYICILISVLCVGWMVLLWKGESRLDVVVEDPEVQYEDSVIFQRDVLEFSKFVTEAAFKIERLETEGKFNEEKIVDVKELVEQGTVSGENRSGLAYKLGDLLAWKEHVDLFPEDKYLIHVCQQPDGTYHYYTKEEFQAHIDSGEFRLKEDSYENEAVYDRDGNIIYAKNWDYDGFYIYQFCAPIGYGSLIDFVNQNSEFNGELSSIMSDLEYAINEMWQDYEQYLTMEHEWSEGDTNAVYYIRNMKTGRTYTNKQKLDKDLEYGLNWMRRQKKYVIITPKRVNFESNIGISSEKWEKQLQELNVNMDDYIFAYSVDTKFPIQDSFYSKAQQYDKWQPVMRKICVLGTVMGSLAILGFIFLTAFAGRSNNCEGVRLFWFDRIHTEVFSLVFFAGLGIQLYYLYRIMRWKIESYTSIPVLSLIISAAAIVVTTEMLVLWLGLVRRVKAGTIWNNSITRYVYTTFKMGARNLSYMKKVAGTFLLVICLHWIGFVLNSGFVQICILIVDFILCIVTVRHALNIQKLKAGVMSIADGEVDYQVDLRGLSGEQLVIAKSINQIGDGLEKALQESIKNERMKTDLITNVSHDIKTPLTSIINYIGLLKMENFEDPKVRGYLDVLDEKSQRLKILTEDVVEASKLSSGNVKLEMINLDFGELVNQACAELNDKFCERNLTLILNIPEEPVIIYADGRRLWRVLSNLLVNASKYALAGTRVYVDIKVEENKTYFIIKNISEMELNISPDELTERFIRGDVARTTQGSGLGLSIARSLTELQGGTMKLYLDGDLFKVELCFSKTEE